MWRKSSTEKFDVDEFLMSTSSTPRYNSRKTGVLVIEMEKLVKVNVVMTEDIADGEEVDDEK